MATSQCNFKNHKENKMNLSGVARLGKDIEIKTTPSGQIVGELSLAYNFGKKDAGGNRPSQWVKASLWGDQAQRLSPYLLKGKQVCVTLKDVNARAYTNKDGAAAASLEGTVIDVVLISDGVGGNQQQSNPTQRPAPPNQNAYANARSGSARPPVALPTAPSAGGFEDMDDDIPY
jgi:single-strand DNA-binding protein